jgi:F420-non-reducing hydrogenase small subunit
MPEKLKIAFFLGGGCGGCDMAAMDAVQAILDLQRLEIAFWSPIVTDNKYEDLAAIPDGAIDVGFYSGMIRLSDQELAAKTMRRKCKTLIAYGTCAALGGVPGLGNFHTRKEMLRTIYFDTCSTENPAGITPQTECLEGECELTLPEFYGEVRPLKAVVEVDHFLGGCPPHHSFIEQIIRNILEKGLEPLDLWITDSNTVCEVCARNPVAKGEQRKPVGTVKRLTDGIPDGDRCLLEQGYLCLGPLTQGSCGALCPRVNVPCAGCGGPIPGVKDFGLRAVSTVASLLENEELVAQIPGPAKLFYRYTLPASLFGKKVK